MSRKTGNRFLGLSPRARKVALPAVVAAALVIAVGSYATSRGDGGGEPQPVVGDDLHSIGQMKGRIFVGGHAGAASRRPGPDKWVQIGSLEDKDIMGWAANDERLFAGGHGGLYSSLDDGASFSPVPGLPVSDVHGLGSSGAVVYVASPQSGILASADFGATFTLRSSRGRDFMGAIWVDPNHADIAIAASMQQGIVRTSDGGVTWTPIGGPPAVMSVAVDRTGGNLVAVSGDGAWRSTDAGASWAEFSVPEGTSAISYTSDGGLAAAVRTGDRAAVFVVDGAEWNPLP